MFCSSSFFLLVLPGDLDLQNAALRLIIKPLIPSAKLDSAQATVSGVYLAGKTMACVHIFLPLQFEFSDIQNHATYKNIYTDHGHPFTDKFFLKDAQQINIKLPCL